MSGRGLSEAARRELLPTGALRLAVNVANAEMAAERSPGRFEGKAIDLAERLAADWGIAVAIVPFASGGAILAETRSWDVAVLAVEASRRDRLHFSPPFATIDATFATVGALPARTCRAADAPGVRIAVVSGAAYAARLERDVEHARLVAFETPAAARAAMLSGECDFVAGIRSTLSGLAESRPGVRLMDDDFLRVPQALAVTLGKPNAAAALDRWFETSAVAP